MGGHHHQTGACAQAQKWKYFHALTGMQIPRRIGVFGRKPLVREADKQKLLRSFCRPNAASDAAPPFGRSSLEMVHRTISFA
jgi:hypothetical protein